MIKSSDGLLYYALKDGYTRTKTTIIRPIGSPEPILLDSENEVNIVSTEVPSEGGAIIGFRIISAYQNSGGDRNIRILRLAGNAKIIRLVVTSDKGVSLGLEGIMFPHMPSNPMVAFWTAATVADQHIMIQAYEQVPVEDV